MSDKDLGDALLKLDLTPSPMATALQVDRIIEEDRRRVQWLARITVALWVLAALGALLIFIVGGFVFPAIAKNLNDATQAVQAAKAAKGEWPAPNQTDTAFLMLAKLLAACIVVGFLSFVLMMAAGLATVLLVFRSRRATLRQINANLLQISEQLKSFAGRQPSPGT